MWCRSGAFLLIIGSIATGACGGGETSAITAVIQQSVQDPRAVAIDRAVTGDARAFYEARAFAPAWTQERNLSRASQALAVIASAAEHGLDPEDYDYAELQQSLQSLSSGTVSDADRVNALATLDTRFTNALLSLGQDVAVGRVNPSTIDRRWKARREPPDFVGTLASSVDHVDTWLKAIQPRHPEYEQLRAALAHLQGAADPIENREKATAALAINLERWRWLPDDLGDRHILVNVPSFALMGREHGVPTITMKVVVGKNDGHETPLFSAEMKDVVFSPYWNVPESIAEGETLPAIMKDFSYLERNHIEIVRRSKSGATVVDPLSVDWEDPADVRRVSFRQRPGDLNSLGRVKFLFPNPYDVYLHDTPADALFARPVRALSHGCVRVERPGELATWVLRDLPAWTPEKIAAAMASNNEQHTALPSQIPVHIVYFTAWVDGGGAVHYEPDIYRYDAKQLAGHRAQDS